MSLDLINIDCHDQQINETLNSDITLFEIDFMQQVVLIQT